MDLGLNSGDCFVNVERVAEGDVKSVAHCYSSEPFVGHFPISLWRRLPGQTEGDYSQAPVNPNREADSLSQAVPLFC